jgi:oligopeptide/dipeptide ABC transporter ATP-binding protein
MTPILKVQGLEIKYHTREGILTAIRNASLEVNAGEIVGIVGESGCGKSTISSALLRLLPPNGRITAGRVTFCEQDLLALDEEAMRRLRGKEIAMIFQDPMTSLNPVFSVEQQMVDALRAHAHDRESGSGSRQRAVEMLDRVGIPDAELRIKDYPHQFSGGMRQRIMIATALLSGARLLIADEPTSALDVTLEAQIIDLMRGLRDEFGTALLYITHDLGVVAQLCDRVLVMYAGNIVESGEVFGIFERPKHPYTQALLNSHPSYCTGQDRLTTIPGRVPSLRELPTGCKFAPRCALAQPMCHFQEPAYVAVEGQDVLCHAYAPGWLGAPPEEAVVLGRLPGGRGAKTQRGEDAESRAGMRESDLRQAEIILETRALRTHFQDERGLLARVLGAEVGAVRALDGVDLQLRRGETLALVGESGSGKTTLGRTVLRLVEATSGGIVVEGQDITTLPQSRVRPLRARMQMIFQDPASSLSPRMKVSSILLEPYRIHGITPKPDQVDKLLAMVGLSSEQCDKYPHQLSGGQARRVGIARALALHPDILVADEPTSGLDVSVAAGILNLLKDLREQLNLSYLIITHNLSVINFIADRAAVMYLGKIVELCDTPELFDRPLHPYSEALMSAIALPDPRLRDRAQRIILKGEIPSPRNPPPGCPFHPRCRYAQALCSREVPPLEEKQGSGRKAACHFPLADG